MDKKTKKKLSKYAAELTAMIDRINEIENDVEGMASDERDKYENAPESLQYSDKYTEMEQIADDLDSLIEESFYNATSAIDEIVDTFKSITKEDEENREDEELKSLEKEAIELKKKLTAEDKESLKAKAKEAKKKLNDKGKGGNALLNLI